MAILPSGDIPENPLQSSPPRGVSGSLPVTEDLYTTLSRPIPAPSRDWFTTSRNMFLCLGAVAVTTALLVATNQPTAPQTQPSKLTGPFYDMETKTEPLRATPVKMPLRATPVEMPPPAAARPSGSAQQAIYHPKAPAIEIVSEPPAGMGRRSRDGGRELNQASMTGRPAPSKSLQIPAQAEPLPRSSPGIPLLPDPQ